MFNLFKKEPYYIIHLSEDTGVPPIPVFDKKITIGRSVNHVLAIPDQSISRNHVDVIFNEGVITITDLGTANGTKLNDQPIPANLPVEYYEGQVLTLGNCPVMIQFEYIKKNES